MGSDGERSADGQIEPSHPLTPIPGSPGLRRRSGRREGKGTHTHPHACSPARFACPDSAPSGPRGRPRPPAACGAQCAPHSSGPPLPPNPCHPTPGSVFGDIVRPNCRLRPLLWITYCRSTKNGLDNRIQPTVPPLTLVLETSYLTLDLSCRRGERERRRIRLRYR